MRARFPKVLDVVEPCVDALVAVGKSGELENRLVLYRSRFLRFRRNIVLVRTAGVDLRTRRDPRMASFVVLLILPVWLRASRRKARASGVVVWSSLLKAFPKAIRRTALLGREGIFLSP